MIPLKEATYIKHKQAERMPFNARMFKGLITKNEYLLYLNQQLPVFLTIERFELPHDSLRRAEKVQEDIEELNIQGYSSNQILTSTMTYVDYLGSLSYEQILPHIYLNYLAIMFGGQTIKIAVPSKGRMYVFENMEESVQSIRNVQKDIWAEEVNKGFDFNISILNELELVCNKGPLISTN